MLSVHYSIRSLANVAQVTVKKFISIRLETRLTIRHFKSCLILNLQRLSLFSYNYD